MKRIIVVLLLVILAISVISCTDTKVENNNKSVEKEVSEEKITVYISGPEEMINKLEKEFEADRGDVSDFLIMSCGQVRSKVWTESEAGQIQADVVFGSDPLIYNMLEDKDLLDTINVKNADMIADEFKLNNHNYYFVNERYITMIYNKDNLKEELPLSYKELAYNDIKYSVVMADGRQSSTGLGIAIALYQLDDNKIEYYKQLKEKDFMLTKSNGQVPSLVMEGQYDIGVAPYDVLVRLKMKAKKDGYELPLKTIWPEEGPIVIRRPIGVIKNPERSEEKQKNSEELVDFFLSKEAQMIISKMGFVSVRKDIENQLLPEYIEKHLINWEKATNDEQKFKEQYSEVFK